MRGFEVLVVPDDEMLTETDSVFEALESVGNHAHVLGFERDSAPGAQKKTGCT